MALDLSKLKCDNCKTDITQDNIKWLIDINDNVIFFFCSDKCLEFVLEKINKRHNLKKRG